MSENVSKHFIGSGDLKKKSSLVDKNMPGRNHTDILPNLSNEPSP